MLPRTTLKRKVIFLSPLLMLVMGSLQAHDFKLVNDMTIVSLTKTHYESVFSGFFLLDLKHENKQTFFYTLALTGEEKDEVIEQTINGKVTDGETGEPLPGVNVLGKGTTSGPGTAGRETV